MITSNLPAEMGANRGDCVARASLLFELDRSPVVSEFRLFFRSSRSLLSARLGCSLSLPWCKMECMLKDVLRGEDFAADTSSACEIVNFLCTAETTSLTAFVD